MQNNKTINIEVQIDRLLLEEYEITTHSLHYNHLRELILRIYLNKKETIKAAITAIAEMNDTTYGAMRYRLESIITDYKTPSGGCVTLKQFVAMCINRLSIIEREHAQSN